MNVKMKNYQEQLDVIVVGGGASGMIAAGRAAERGKRVLLLEKNKSLGEKLKITGGGRCNITNAQEDPHLLLKHYGKAEQFLYSPFSAFGVKETFAFFESKGLPIVVQEKKRAFPASEKASDVLRVFEKYLQQGKVAIKLSTNVTKIVTEGKLVKGVIAGSEEYNSKALILATGGSSHPETGSTGDGFLWLAELSHRVKSPTPTIVPLAVAEQWIKNSAGIALDSMKITFFLDGRKKFSLKGRILFTHFGISGPLILNNAGRIGDMLHEGVVTAAIDIYPDKNQGELEEWMLTIFDANKNKNLKNVFKSIAPKGMAPHLLPLFVGVGPDTKVHSITKEQRKVIARQIKSLPVTITNLMGYDRAVVVDGGVAPSEIDMKTMRSRLYDNLFIVGDLLDINRPSGGYSLQLCWTTGYIAGDHV